MCLIEELRKSRIKTIKNDDEVTDDKTYPSQIFNFSKITISKKSYFVLGDNRDHSNDNRFWGVVKQEDIFGVFNGVIYFNFKDLSRINLRVF